MTEPNKPDNDATHPSAGSQLARQRRQHELSIAEVSAALKLPRSVIENIEADRVDRIAGIYRRGYVANYARLLEMDPGPLLEAIGSGVEDAPALRSVLPVSRRGVNFDRFVKFATYFLVTTLIVPPLIYFFVIGGTRLFEREVVETEPGAPVAEVVASESGDGGVSRRIARALSLDPASDAQGEQAHLSASTLPLTSMRPLASSPIPTASENELDESSPTGSDDQVQSVLSTLEIDLLDDSWVEITDASGQRLEFDLLRAGASRTYEALPPFRVLLGRASAVEMTLDGQPVRFEGQGRGSVAEISLPGPSDESAEVTTRVSEETRPQQ